MSKAKYSNKELLETVKHWHYLALHYVGTAVEDDHFERLEAIQKLIQNQSDKRYEAKIFGEKTTIKFCLSDLVERNDSFTVRDLILPWLLIGNKPELIKGE